MSLLIERKYKLIQEIIETNDEKLIQSLESKVFSDINFLEAVEPVKNAETIDELIEQQNFKPINKKQILKEIQELDIQEGLDELLEMLK